MERIKILDIYKTKVNNKTNGKQSEYKVILNNGEEFLLSDNEIVKYSLHIGNEFDIADWDEKIKFIEIDKAYNKGLYILLFKKNSKRQLKEKLLNKDFSEEIIDGAIEKLEQAGYLNDEKYAESYIKSISADKYKTKYQIVRELTKKGIDSDTIERALNGYSDDICGDLEIIKQFINNKYINLIKGGNIEYNKLVGIKRSLYNKGYDPDVVDEAIENLRKELQIDEGP